MRKSGELYWTRLSITPMRDDAGTITHFVAINEDISERKTAEQHLQLAAQVYAASSEAIIIADADVHIVDVNNAFETITGYSRAEAVGRDPSLLRSDRHDKAFFRQLWESLRSEQRWQGEIWNKRKNGDVLSGLALGQCHLRPNRKHQPLCRRLDRHHRAQGFRSPHPAHGPSRLSDRPAQPFSAGRPLQPGHRQLPKKRQSLGLLFIDLDRFKNVNDILGHSVGDLLLCAAARRIVAVSRGTDTVTRQGGDEFVVLLDDLDSPEKAGTVAPQTAGDPGRTLPAGGA